MNAESVGYIERVRDTQQQFFDLHATIDPSKLKIPKDWLENSEDDPKYIQNRTHYVLPDRFELLKTNWFMVNEQGQVVENPANAPEFFKINIDSQTYSISRGYKSSDTYATEDEILAGAGALEEQYITLLKKGSIYNNGSIWSLKDYFELIEGNSNLFNYLQLNETGDNTKHAYQLILQIDRDIVTGEPLPAIKYFYVIAVKDPGEYRFSLATTPYWGVREAAGIREWYKIEDYSTLAEMVYGEVPATPTIEPPPSQFELNKYYLESTTLTHTFEEGIYCFCEFDRENINYSQDFMVNGEEKVVQLPKKYIQDVWDAIEQFSGDTTALEEKLTIVEGKIVTNEGKIAILEGKVSTLEATKIPTIETAIRNLSDTKLNTNNPTATGNFTLEVDKVVMNGTTGVITASDLITSNLPNGLDSFVTSIPNTYATKVEVNNGLSAKRDDNDFEFNNNTAAHFAGDLYVNGLANNANAKKVATEDQLVKFLGLYYEPDSNFVYPSAQNGDYIFIIKDNLGTTNNKLVRSVFNGSGWSEQNEIYDRLFTNEQWININTSYDQDIADLNDEINSLTTLIGDFQTEINSYENLINELIPQAEGNWFGPSTFQPYVNANYIAYPRD